MFVLAVMGAGVMYLLFGWLLSAILSSLFSSEKGYGERPGLASGLIAPPLGVLGWLVAPARADSDWKVAGPTTAATVAMVVSLVIGVAALVVGSGVAGIIDDPSAAAQILLVVYGVLMTAGAAFALATAPKPAGRATTA